MQSVKVRLPEYYNKTGEYEANGDENEDGKILNKIYLAG